MGNVSDISIYNNTTTELTTSISVVRVSDGKQLLRDTFTLSTNPQDYEAEKVYQEVVDHDTTVRIAVSVQTGPTGTYEFTESADARGAVIDIYQNQIKFSTVVD